MMKYKKLLEDEIAAELEAMQEMDTISDDYRVAVDGLTKLIDRSIELEKLENSKSDEKDKAEFDKIDKLLDHSISVIGILIPVALTVWGVHMTFEFEKEGTVTTLMGKSFINKLIKK